MRTHYVLLLGLALVCLPARADHFAGGTITTRCTGNNWHEVTLRLYRNCSGVALLPQSLRFSSSCGVEFVQTGWTPLSVEDVSSLCPDELPNSSCNGGSLLGFDMATYRDTVYLSPCANWTISWDICCRNSSLNVTGTPGLYVETTLNNLNGACNAAPSFADHKVPMVCLGQPVSFDASAMEPDGDQLTYALIDARFASPAPLPVNYQPGFNGETPFTGMAIDPESGLITFTPTVVGAIIVSVEVTERGSASEVKGTVMRDMLFVVTACSNQPPSATSGTITTASGSATMVGDRAVEVCGIQPFCATITISDPDIGQALSISSDLGVPGLGLSINGTNPVVVELCSESTPVGEYSVWIVATDNGCPVVAARTYQYTIVVNAEAHAGESASLTVCENAQWVNLFDHLGGTPTAGGQWMDPEGNATTGVFVPGETLPGIHTYTVGTGTCEASATVSVVLRPATDPECLLAGIIGVEHSGLSMVPDATNLHRYWITSPAMSATYRILNPDGRLLLTGRFNTLGTTPTALDLPVAHHGPALFVLHDGATGAQYVLRAMVP